MRLNPTRIIEIRDIEIGGNRPLALIAGPCVIEGQAHALECAARLKEICREAGVPLIFKSSYDKANRSSIDSFRGPGMDEGLKVLSGIREETGLAVLSDVHKEEDIGAAAEVLDIIQIPAFLSRQTDLLVRAARTGKSVNVKKGQFLSPWDMTNIVRKLNSAGCDQVILTERGSSFGYNNLVVDFRSLVVMRKTGCPVAFDVTHALQLPGGLGKASGGQREFIPEFARAATAVGVDALFMEVHPDPDNAPCDGPNMLAMDDLPRLLEEVKAIDAVAKGG